MHLERCTPLQRKPDGFIVSPLRGFGQGTEERHRRSALGRLGNERVAIALEEFAGIQQDGHRTFISQFDAHGFLETAGFTTQARGLNPLHK